MNPVWEPGEETWYRCVRGPEYNRNIHTHSFETLQIMSLAGGMSLLLFGFLKFHLIYFYGKWLWPSMEKTLSGSACIAGQRRVSQPHRADLTGLGCRRDWALQCRAGHQEAVDGLGLRAGMHCLGKSSKCFLQKLRGEQGTISLVTPEQRSLWKKQCRSPTLSQTGPTPTAGEFRRQLTRVRIPCDVGTVASQKMRRDLLRLMQLWGDELGEPGSAWYWSLHFVHQAWRQHRDCVAATAVAAATGVHLKRTSYMTGALRDFI